MQFILASASPARRQLLRRAGFRFRCVPPRVPETRGRGLTLDRAVLENADRKAAAVSRLHPDRWVLAADTMIGFAGRLYGKPASRAAAEALLARMAGRWHVLATGVVLRRGERVIRKSVRTRVRIRKLNRAALRAVLAAQDPTSVAGGYRVRAKDDPLIERIVGSYSNVVGLPMEWVTARLRRLGAGNR